MKFKIALCLAGFLVASAFAHAEIPSIVTDGLAAYQKSGGQAALKVWLKGSPMESDTTTTMQMNGLFSQIDTVYGKMIGFDSVRVVRISNSTERIYLVMNFEKGPMFTYIDCYKVNSGWIIPILECNAKASTVFPQKLLDGSSQ
jgi:hypothetical protein